MKKIIFGLFILGLTTSFYGQEIALAEVEVVANYDYINAINTELIALPVKNLKAKVLEFKAEKGALEYEDGISYNVYFNNSDGKIIVAYDTTGKIVKTTEQYKNVRLPLDVLKAIVSRFPNWTIVEDTYHENYHCDKGVTEKHYKIQLANADKTVDIKTDEKGNFI